MSKMGNFPKHIQDLKVRQSKMEMVFLEERFLDKAVEIKFDEFNSYLGIFKKAKEYEGELYVYLQYTVELNRIVGEAPGSLTEKYNLKATTQGDLVEIVELKIDEIKTISVERLTDAFYQTQGYIGGIANVLSSMAAQEKTKISVKQPNPANWGKN